MGFFKSLAVIGGAVGAVVLAPVVLPAAAAAGAVAAATAGTAIAGTAAAAGTALASTAVGSVAVGAATAVGTAAATAGAAVASTAAGTAAIGAMTAVGSGVGAAAGAVGLSSVATIAGTSAGAAAIGTITTSAVVGAGSAISGAAKNKKASGLLDAADCDQRQAKKSMDENEESLNKQLEELGKCKISIWKKLQEYIDICSKVKNIPDKGELELDGMIHFDKLELAEIKGITMSLKDVLGGSVATLTGGQLAGLATSTGFTSIATASTGTAIAGLHGAAAANASLAALGGGSLGAGGLGMAGGAIVANALTFAPALAIGGMFINSKGSKNLKNAEKAQRAVNDYAEQVDRACAEMNKLKSLGNDMQKCLRHMEPVFVKRIEWLTKLTEKTTDFRQFNEDQQKNFYITFKTAMILADLTCTQLINGKNNKVEVASVKSKIEDQGVAFDKLTA